MIEVIKLITKLITTLSYISFHLIIKSTNKLGKHRITPTQNSITVKRNRFTLLTDKELYAAIYFSQNKIRLELKKERKEY